MKLQEKRRSETPARTRSVRDTRSDDYNTAGKNRNSHGGVLRAKEIVGNQAELEAMGVLRVKAESMRKEIAEQERLLTAYQKENERLVDKAKKVSNRAWLAVNRRGGRAAWRVVGRVKGSLVLNQILQMLQMLPFVPRL